jgi:hypothetical protein
MEIATDQQMMNLETSTETGPMTDPDYDPTEEFEAMGSIATTLKKLPEEARGRVLEYMIKLFAKKQLITAPAESDASTQETQRADDAQTFADFPSLFGAATTDTGTERALLAGYYLQVVKGLPDFDSFSANKELRHVGYEAANITRDFDNLMVRTPALMMQTKKLGSTKQARKQYRLTAAGINLVKEMLGR